MRLVSAIVVSFLIINVTMRINMTNYMIILIYANYYDFTVSNSMCEATDFNLTRLSILQ